MLVQFTFNNFKSFRDEVTLDMTASGISEHKNHVADIANDKILKIAAIYGANASGKSNIYDAYKYMTYYVVNSFKFGGEDTSESENNYLNPTPFIFDGSSKNEASSFEIFFVDNEDKTAKTYQYGFKLKSNEVIEEWLYYKSKTSKDYRSIFYRNKDEKNQYDGIKKGSDNIEMSLEKETLIVSLGSKLKISKLKMVRDWFMKNELVDFGNPAENYLLSRIIPKDFIDEKDEQMAVIKYLSTFDDAIKDFDVERKQTDGNKNRIKINAFHKMIDSDDLGVLPFKDESSGTLKMFALYAPIKSVLEKGSTLFIDELNTRLHPLLVRNIILMFSNPKLNLNNAQLLFTTHDSWQLSNDVLRRDEIWFVDKSSDGVSDLFSLIDFVDNEGGKIRKDEMYSKNYLLGKYGAIPILKSFNILKGE